MLPIIRVSPQELERSKAMAIYAIYNNAIYRNTDDGQTVRLLSSDDEYFTAIEWLTERGLL